MPSPLSSASFPFELPPLQLVRNRVLASAGATALLFALRRSLSNASHAVPTHPLLASSFALTRLPAVVQIASELSSSLSERDFFSVAEKLKKIAEEDSKERGSSQWIMSRLSREVVRDAREACSLPLGDVEGSGGSREDLVDALVLRVRAKDELIPLLESALENVLYNHMLRVGA